MSEEKKEQIRPVGAITLTVMSNGETLVTPFELPNKYTPFLVHALGQFIVNIQGDFLSQLFKKPDVQAPAIVGGEDAK